MALSSFENGGWALAARDVVVRYGGVRALSEVSVGFQAGQVCGLIGPNGAGKTTLFDALSGVRTVAGGTIHLNGEDVTGRSPTWRARHGLRRTFQRQQIFGWLTVEENVLVALEWHAGGGGLLADLVALPSRARRERANREKAAEVLDMCGLTADRDVPAARLPIGRARMVELARAIVDHPTALLLDEPTSGLEAAEAERLGATIQQLRVTHNCAVVLVEHDVPFVMKHCDRIVVLSLGVIIADGTPDEIKSDPAVGVAYLG